MILPISYSEKIDYRIQYSMSNFLHKSTEQMQWLRFPAFLGLGAHCLTKLPIQTLSVIELTIHGLGLILSSSASSPKRIRGQALLKKAPINLLNLAGSALDCIECLFIVIGEPKLFIFYFLERSKIDFTHARAGTIGSQKHVEELSNSQGIAHAQLLRWQGVSD